MAKARVLACNTAHDQCIQTPDIPRPGQNLCWFEGGNTPLQVMDMCMAMWFNEKDIASPEDIKSYKVSPGMIGHFTGMLQDRSDRIGCAIVKYDNNNQFAVCNYAFINFSSYRVYQKCSNPERVAKGCKTGPNPNYPGLCSEKEIVTRDATPDIDEDLWMQTMPSTQSTEITTAASPATTTRDPVQVLLDFDIEAFFESWAKWEAEEEKVEEEEIKTTVTEPWGNWGDWDEVRTRVSNTN